MPRDDDHSAAPPGTGDPGLHLLDEDDDLYSRAPAKQNAPAGAPGSAPDVFVFDEGYAGAEADQSEVWNGTGRGARPSGASPLGDGPAAVPLRRLGARPFIDELDGEDEEAPTAQLFLGTPHGGQASKARDHDSRSWGDPPTGDDRGKDAAADPVDPWTDALHGRSEARHEPSGDLAAWDDDIADLHSGSDRGGGVPWSSPPVGGAPPDEGDDPFGPGGALDAAFGRAFGRAFGDELPTQDPVPDPAVGHDPWESAWRSPRAEEDEPESASLPLNMGAVRPSLQEEMESRPLLDPERVLLKQLDSPMLGNTAPAPTPADASEPAPVARSLESRVRRPAHPSPVLNPLGGRAVGGGSSLVWGLLVSVFIGVLGYAGYQAWLHLVKGQPHVVQILTGEGPAEEPALPADSDLEPEPPAEASPDAAAADAEPAAEGEPTVELTSREERDIARSQGMLRVITDRPADVWVDGVRVGRTPMRALPLQPGWHEVKVVAATGRRTRHTAKTRVDRGQARQVAVAFADLESKRRR